MSKFSNAALRLTAGALVLDAGVKKLERRAKAPTPILPADGGVRIVPAVAKLDAAKPSASSSPTRQPRSAPPC